MSDKMVLVKYDCNYADEFDLEGFVVMSQLEWLKHITSVEKHFQKWDSEHEPDRWGNREGIEVYFGTNEQIIYEGFESYRRSFEVTELSDTDYKTLERLFGKTYGGQIRHGMLALIEPDLEDDEMEEEDEESEEN